MLQKILTYSHILAGILSLVVAPIAMAVSKGGRVHRLSGKIFFWAMTWIFITAVILSAYYKWIPFLLMVSVLSYYLTVSGYRTLYQKQLSSGKGVLWYDWLAVIATGLFMLGFAVWGINLWMNNQASGSVFLILGFSIGGLLSVRGELKAFIKPPLDKNRWLFKHIGRMIGAFIASVTAFSVNVLTFIPGIWPWIWPTLIGTPLIVYWVRMYKKKLTEGVRISELVELKR
ncbi:MAG TPA: hypothetical protein VIT44_03130 [Cyclobacteriaceae bacterium]